VPGVNTDTCQEETGHIQTWTAFNKLKLNRNKTKEIVFSSRRQALALPPPRPDIDRVTSLQVIGVIVNDKLTAADHVTMLLSSCISLLYAILVLRSHGTPTTSLHDTVVTRIQYAAPAWSGMSSATDRARLDSLLRRGKRLGYCSNDVPTVTELFNS